MRRSAAPSIRADIKRARFLPHIIQNISYNDKENKSFRESAMEFPSTTKDSSDSSYAFVPPDHTVAKSKVDGEKIRSNEDILDLILEADTTAVEKSAITNNNLIRNEENNLDNSSKSNKLSTNLKPLKRSFLKVPLSNKIVEESSTALSNCIYCTKTMEEASLFNVVWCKRSGKKHKTWEGDGFLIVKSRSAVLKDFSGKMLDKGVGYKLKETEALEEGSKFFIGGKECEIQCIISEEELQSGKYCKCSSVAETVVEEEKPLAHIKKPCQ